MTRSIKYALMGLALFGAQADAGDTPPLRTITLSGECQSCSFSEENLYGARFIGARFLDGQLQETQLLRSQIRESYFLNSNLTGANLSMSRLSGASFEGSTLVSVNFSGSRGERVNFEGAELVDAVFTDSHFILTNFEEADLSGAVLTNAQLFHANFEKARLDNASFVGARLPRAIFNGADAENIVFVDADLSGADFSNAVLINADFTGARLRGARFSGASIIAPVGLNQEALDLACADDGAILPANLDLHECPHSAPQVSAIEVGRPRVSSGDYRLVLEIDENGERRALVVPGSHDDQSQVLIEVQRAAQMALVEAQRAAWEMRREVEMAGSEIAESVHEALSDLEVDAEGNEARLLELERQRARLAAIVENNPEAFEFLWVIDGAPAVASGDITYEFRIQVPPKAPDATEPPQEPVESQ